MIDNKIQEIDSIVQKLEFTTINLEEEITTDMNNSEKVQKMNIIKNKIQILDEDYRDDEIPNPVLGLWISDSSLQQIKYFIALRKDGKLETGTFDEVDNKIDGIYPCRLIKDVKNYSSEQLADNIKRHIINISSEGLQTEIITKKILFLCL